jgi:hypothetical protein
LYIYATFSWFIHLSRFYSLGIVNSAALNIGMQVSLLYPDLCSFGYSPGVVLLIIWKFYL